MTDCKGAFAFGYEVDIAGAEAAFAQYAGAEAEEQEKPSAGMTGSSRRHADQYRRLRLRRRHSPARGRGDEAPDGAARRGRHDRPAVRRRGGPVANYAKHNRRRRSSSAPPGRRTRRCRSRRRTSSATTATAPSGTPARGDRLQEARLAYGRAHRGRLQLPVDVSRRHHRRLLRSRRQDHEAGVPAAEHDGLLVVHPAAAGTEQGGRLLLGGRRCGHVPSLNAFEQAYGPLTRSSIGNLFFDARRRQDVAPHVSGAYVGGFGTFHGGRRRYRRHVREEREQVVHGART